MKIAITGSLASGKTSATKFLSKGKYPTFNADNAVKQLYSQTSFIKKVRNKFKINKNRNVKQTIKREILKSNIKLNKIEKLIHPFVRSKMYLFLKKNSKYKYLFFEIPLLIESNLQKKFDITIFVTSKKNKRLIRFIKKGGSKRLFNILDKRQLSPKKKKVKCDYTVVNNSSLKVLKKQLLNIMSNYD